MSKHPFKRLTSEQAVTMSYISIAASATATDEAIIDAAKAEESKKREKVKSYCGYQAATAHEEFVVLYIVSITLYCAKRSYKVQFLVFLQSLSTCSLFSSISQ